MPREPLAEARAERRAVEPEHRRDQHRRVGRRPRPRPARAAPDARPSNGRSTTCGPGVASRPFGARRRARSSIQCAKSSTWPTVRVVGQPARAALPAPVERGDRPALRVPMRERSRDISRRCRRARPGTASLPRGCAPAAGQSNRRRSPAVGRGPAVEIARPAGIARRSLSVDSSWRAGYVLESRRRLGTCRCMGDISFAFAARAAALLLVVGRDRGRAHARDRQLEERRDRAARAALVVGERPGAVARHGAPARRRARGLRAVRRRVRAAAGWAAATSS